MKHLGIVPILLLVGLWIASGPATAELTARQQINPSQAAVGETVMVTVMLTYNGADSTQATVTPNPPPGIVSDSPGGLSADLRPGVTEPIGYPIRAEQSGTYWIESQITYTEEGTLRNLRLETPFTAIGSVGPEPQPREQAISEEISAEQSLAM
ncbi:Uncharacterised protein [uncultured archaeon]|nr:Uncharacterised protein [uncultured archaeon]